MFLTGVRTCLCCSSQHRTSPILTETIAMSNPVVKSNIWRRPTRLEFGAVVRLFTSRTWHLLECVFVSKSA